MPASFAPYGLDQLAYANTRELFFNNTISELRAHSPDDSGAAVLSPAALTEMRTLIEPQRLTAYP
ncbi:hypothetical protein KGA66_04705 [Actinocrinis puniceicyclus]|uniref:Uncharacterized protein n=1 Tax=Actinocrinis puniceicyclus TaxID=977794 RepID=A0A8J8BBD0_9ACTN|nr:hypothetical protein [Actinocrinis puniceicyclus]MBS2962335.1 hypothetical protein [Actinocrinis puniceicyclus]